MSQQLPSVLTLFDSAFSVKSAKKSRIQIAAEKDFNKDTLKKTFMFTSDLIFGRLEDSLGKKELGQLVQPIVPSEPEKGLGLRVNKLPNRSDPSKPKNKIRKDSAKSRMKKLPDEKQKPEETVGTKTNCMLPSSVCNDQNNAVNSLVKTEPIDEMDNRSDNAKNFSIERILGKDEQVNPLETQQSSIEADTEVKVEKSPQKTPAPTLDKQTSQNNKQTNRLPNISQFFEPIDNMEFERCTVAKCDIGTNPSTHFTWFTGENSLGTFPTPMVIKDYPLLRNTGRLEFNRSTLSVLQDDYSKQSIEVKKEESPMEVTEITKSPQITSNESDDEEFASQPLQTRQQQQVSNTKGFRCEKCGKIYCRKYVLKIHMRTHSGEKPLKCEVCGKSFSDPSNMKKHVKLHETDHVTYPCKFCGRNFVRRRGLLNHLHSMHSRFPFIHPQI